MLSIGFEPIERASIYKNGGNTVASNFKIENPVVG